MKFYHYCIIFAHRLRNLQMQESFLVVFLFILPVLYRKNILKLFRSMNEVIVMMQSVNN